MSPDEYSMLRDMLADQSDSVNRLVDRFDANLAAQNRIVRQVANAQAQSGVLNTRVTSVDRALRELSGVVDGLDDRLAGLPPERLKAWDGAAEILSVPERVKGWDDASRNFRGIKWIASRSWKVVALVGTTAGGSFALLVKLLGA